MTAREEAIDAIAAAFGDVPPLDLILDAVPGDVILDAVPDDVLVRYAVERGALVETCRCGHPEDAHGQTNEEMADNVCGRCRDCGLGYGAVHDYFATFRRSDRLARSLRDQQQG